MLKCFFDAYGFPVYLKMKPKPTEDFKELRELEEFLKTAERIELKGEYPDDYKVYIKTFIEKALAQADRRGYERAIKERKLLKETE